ncbi:amidohydrolase [Streptomyces collinus]|uniref:amidohydrolase n=1 Tax=Streptomyces collinus TaxID=42684 RepID=UPI00367F63E8
MSGTEVSRRGVLKRGAGVAAAAGFASIGNVGPASARGADAAARRGADTVVMNGKVLTMDRRDTRAQAVAIKNGCIVAVGSNREISRFAGRGTQVIDAGGGTVLPGINDGHLHFSGFGFEASNFGFQGPRIYNYDVHKDTAAEVAAVIAQAVGQAPTPDSWIRASGWDGTRLDRLPTRDVIDPVSGDHPVYMYDIAHHTVAANSKAMQLAGITRDTVAPSGGIIEKDANGEPTGIFREGATNLISAAVPPYTDAENSEAMEFAASVLHSLGITSLTDPGVSLPTVDLYRRKIKDGSLKLRFNLMLAGGISTDSARAILDGFQPRRDDNPKWLRINEIKVFGDGVPTDAETSWLHEPFIDGRNGRLNMVGDTDAERVAMLHAMIKLAATRGFQVGTHATGDATIDAVVAGYIASKTNHLRHYVIHGDLTSHNTLKKMARNDIPISFNPTIKQVYGRFFDTTLGPARVDYQWPFRSALDAGVKASSASDAAVVTPDWLIGVAGAVTRLGFDGQLGGIEQAITVPEALHSYTSTPAYQDHAEKWKGQLVPGYVGDVAILDGDVLKAKTAEDITGLDVVGTVIGGQVVYDATTSTAPAVRRGAAKVAAYKHQAEHAHAAGFECCCQASERRLRGGAA